MDAGMNYEVFEVWFDYFMCQANEVTQGHRIATTGLVNIPVNIWRMVLTCANQRLSQITYQWKDVLCSLS
jgi:hypothetical protein